MPGGGHARGAHMLHVPWQASAQALVAIQQRDQLTLQRRLLRQRAAVVRATHRHLGLRA